MPHAAWEPVLAKSGVALGAVCLVFSLFINGSGTGELGMLETTAVTSKRYWLGVWLQRTDASPDSAAVSEASRPFYCRQGAETSSNNCPIGRAYHHTDCCKAWELKCNTQKGFFCIASIASFASVVAGAAHVAGWRGGSVVGAACAALAATSVMVGFAVVASWKDGDYWANKTAGAVNEDADCGLGGATDGGGTGGADLKYRLGVGFSLAVVAFVLSIAQCAVMALAGRGGQRAKTAPS